MPVIDTELKCTFSAYLTISYPIPTTTTNKHKYAHTCINIPAHNKATAACAHTLTHTHTHSHTHTLSPFFSFFCFPHPLNGALCPHSISVLPLTPPPFLLFQIGRAHV